MSALHYHLGSMECWQRFKAYANKPRAYLILQSLAAAKNATRGLSIAAITRIAGCDEKTVREHLYWMQKQSLVAFTPGRLGPRTGRSRHYYHLTPTGLSFMTPQAATPKTEGSPA